MEGDLINGLLCRDPNALAELYDLYAPAVYSLLFRITRNPGVAEDLVQELFLRVWQRARHYDAEKGSFSTWILSSARHLALDYLRSAEARYSGSWQGPEREENSRNAIAQEPRPALERSQLLQSAFLKLPASDQRMLELAYFYGYSHTEIAARLEEPLGTVKSRVRAALQHLRAVLPELKVSAISVPGTPRSEEPETLPS